jgi:protein involved in temperature-dependent protein secretion
MNTMNDAQWVLARTRSGEQQAWLAGFGESNPVWVASIDEALAYDREGAEAARLRCTDLPDHNDVLYAVCHLKTDDDANSYDDRVKPISNFENGMLDAVRSLNTCEELRQQIAKLIS